MLIAQQGSKQSTTEFLTRAGQSLQQAIKYWNRYNWKWRLKQATDFSISASSTGFALPWDFKDVYTLRWNGSNPHYLRAVTRRDYDRRWYDQDQPGFPMAYELFKVGELGSLGLVPVPSQAGTAVLKYYSRMMVPCTVSTGTFTVTANQASIDGDYTGVTLGSRIYNTKWPAGTYVNSIARLSSNTSPAISLGFSASATASASGQNIQFGGEDEILDIPEDYENGILAWATGHFLSSLGTPTERLQYFVTLGMDELQEARRANEEQEDLDLSFQTMDEIPLNLINPNATTL